MNDPEAKPMSEADLSQGTSVCDICGVDTPHFHDPEVVEIERLIRPAFEKTTVPGNAFGRPSAPGFPYSDGRIESLFQHFISGWFACKRVYAASQPTPSAGTLELTEETT
jgi:hypothetical protein